jgi:hypothetical protein
MRQPSWVEFVVAMRAAMVCIAQADMHQYQIYLMDLLLGSKLLPYHILQASQPIFLHLHGY